ncbi:putative Peptidase M23 [[Clostridium] ultunense Esp]|nr:putative Peptidase M23 [[Clostridium] ultunense Esp]
MQFIPQGKGEVKSYRFRTIPALLFIGFTFALFLFAILMGLYFWQQYLEMKNLYDETLTIHEQVKSENKTYLLENEQLKKSFEQLNRDVTQLKTEVEKNQSHLEELNKMGGGKSPTSQESTPDKGKSVTAASLLSYPGTALAVGTSNVYIEGIRSELTRLNQQISLQEEAISSFEARLKGHMEAMKRIPMGWPASGRVTSLFGIRKDPFTKKKKMHEGIDFADTYGTPIHATAKGKVIFTGWNGPYGKQVQVDHGNGYITTYSHLSSFTVKEGDDVERGDQIGRMGTTGRSTGVHLHYEVRKNGKPLDPKPFLGGEEIVAQEETAND